MKLILLLALTISSVSHAGFSYYDLKVTCGEVVKVKNGQLLKRLEPSFFGINDKFVLKTRFITPILINETIRGKDKPAAGFISSDTEVVFTSFSTKEKFLNRRDGLKKAMKAADKKGIPLYACVGKLKVEPYKYSGSEIFWSEKSLEDAVAQMRKKARLHL